MWLTRLGAYVFCGYSVEQPLSASDVDMAANCSHPLRPLKTCQPLNPLLDTPGHRVDKQGAEKFDEQICKLVDREHRRMMAVTASYVKTGKRGYTA